MKDWAITEGCPCAICAKEFCDDCKQTLLKLHYILYDRTSMEVDSKYCSNCVFYHQTLIKLGS